MMSPEQALQLLDQTVSTVPLTRERHLLLAEALKVLATAVQASRES